MHYSRSKFLLNAARGYSRYLVGRFAGDVQLSGQEFDDIVGVAKSTTKIYGPFLPGTITRVPVDFYGTNYGYLYGKASMYIDSNFKPIGFYDSYDLDMKEIGERSGPAEVITGVGRFLPYATITTFITHGEYKTTYGSYKDN